jgi:25S rRNA (adenine2142-N1)-methyltransferase
MPSKRRVKRPVTATPKIRISNGGITKPNNQLIRKYHTLNKALSLCEKRKDEKRAAEIRAELEALGGLDAYQQASVKGASVVRGGDTSRWLVKTIGALKLRPQVSTYTILSFFEIN